MEFSREIKDRIKDNMLHITINMKKKPRNYLNKQLQDAVCNYFLENYAAPFLKNEYKINFGRQLRRKIETSLPHQGKKYINLLNKFKSEILRVGMGSQYRRVLVDNVIEQEEQYAYESDEWCTQSRKKMLSILLLIHLDEDNILNFYDMWNSLYPDDPLVKQKLSKEEKEKNRLAEIRVKISEEQRSNQSSISCPSGDYTQLSNSTHQAYNENQGQIEQKSSEVEEIKNNFGESLLQRCQVMLINPAKKVVIKKKKINNRIFEDDQSDEEQEKDSHSLEQSSSHNSNQEVYCAPPLIKKRGGVMDLTNQQNYQFDQLDNCAYSQIISGKYHVSQDQDNFLNQQKQSLIDSGSFQSLSQFALPVDSQKIIDDQPKYSGLNVSSGYFYPYQNSQEIFNQPFVIPRYQEAQQQKLIYSNDANYQWSSERISQHREPVDYQQISYESQQYFQGYQYFA